MLPNFVYQETLEIKVMEIINLNRKNILQSISNYTKHKNM